jgi:hypothetical protein
MFRHKSSGPLMKREEMFMKKTKMIVLLTVVLLIAGCGINSVTGEELENVKAGDVLVYRFQRDGKSWFYADKITRIEGGTIFYNPGRMEATTGNDTRLESFETEELSISRTELLKYETEQGTGRKVIIWIK